MRGALRLGRLFDIDIYVHFSWYLVLALLTWSLAADWFPQSFPGWSSSTYGIAAIVSSLLLFLSVLFHELAHALVAKASNLTVKGMTLFIFGGVSEIEQEEQRPTNEFQIALVGPIANFLIAGLAFLLALPFQDSTTPAEAVLDYLAISNLMLGLFNLVPGFPLDGGRMLHALLWKRTGSFKKSMRVAASVGQVCSYVFILLGIALFFTGNLFNGLWVIFIGWFLLIAAQSTNAQIVIQSMLQDVTIEDVMERTPVTVPANISLQHLIDTYMIPHGLGAVPVIQGEYFSGFITLNDIVRIEQERWSITPVGHIMRLYDQVYTVEPAEDVHTVLQTMVEQDISLVPVVHNRKFVGMISQESIIRYLQLRRQDQKRPPLVA